MKSWALALLVLVFIQKQGNFLQVEAADGFVKTSGMHFVLNGIPYHANGFNAYWLMYVASDPSQRSKISSAFAEAAGHGLTIARTWAFSDGGYRPLQYSPGSYNEQMFQVCLRFLPLFFSLFFIKFLIHVLLSMTFLLHSFFPFLGSKGVGFCSIRSRKIWDKASVELGKQLWKLWRKEAVCRLGKRSGAVFNIWWWFL